MKVLRTPDERFEKLPGYPFSPNYVEVQLDAESSGRMHYVDEGEGPVVLMLHGEPSWSYLYRKMIPPVADAGFRVIAPDLLGFGRSDKPAERDDYSYSGHVDWMTQFLDALDLQEITLVCQDWGGLIGLRLVANQPERFARVVAANTMLPAGEGSNEAFDNWLEFSQSVPEMPIGGIVTGLSPVKPSPEIIAAYDAPYPDESYKAGARAFPKLVPVQPDNIAVEDNKAAWKVLEKFEKPFLTAFSDGDPITKGGEAFFQNRIPGCKGMPHTTIENGGHFLQEDQGEKLAEVVIDFCRNY